MFGSKDGDCETCGKNIWSCSCQSPHPQGVDHSITCDVNIPADRFWIRDSNGHEAQVRLEPDFSVYICYTTQNRTAIESRNVPWADFLREFRKFVDSFPLTSCKEINDGT